MKEGDTITCRNSRGYQFTEGRDYVVVSYDPEWFDTSVPAGFTWPAYVVVRDDTQRLVKCHAHRFVSKE